MKRRVTSLVGVAVAALAALVFPAGVFAGTLDQSQTNVNDNPNDSSPIEFTAGVQNFTAGLSGELDQVDVFMLRDPTCTRGNIAVQIFDRTTDPPEVVTGRPALAHAVIGPGSVPYSFGWVSVEFSSPATVSAGSRYSLRLGSEGCGSNPYRWARASGDPYPGGDGYWVVCFFECGFATGFDHAFKTYVGLPPNEFSFGGVVKDERAGTATLTVYVPRPGTLELAETRKVEGYEETAESPPGVEDLRVTPKGKAKQTLNEEGRVEVRAWVTYTPTNGTANTLSRMIKLVKG